MTATGMVTELARIVSFIEKQQDRKQQMLVMERRILSGVRGDFFQDGGVRKLS